ncbi:hypothetical protein PENTCL1PPCAC_30667, partial [Pristionchus entomophagus]
MIAYWTPVKLVCGMPAPYHGDSIWLWSKVLNVVNGTSAIFYFITWQTVKKRGAAHSSKRVFVSIAVVMAFEVSGWFISSTLINLSRILMYSDKRPPFHYFACLFVNFGIAVKTPVYYAIRS